MAEITISEETLPAGFWRFSGSTCELRIAANQSFRNSEGQLIPRGLVSKPNTCLVVKTCTVNEDLSVTIPIVTELFTTDDSIDLPTVTYTAALFPRRSSQRQMWPDEATASGFALPTYLTADEPGTNWARIVLANLGAPLINPPSTWPTFSQMVAYVRTVLYQKATSVLFGLVRLSKAADNSADPIAVGKNDLASITNAGIVTTTTSSSQVISTNDTRIPTQALRDAMVGTSGTPSSSNKYVTESDPILSILSTPSVFDANASPYNCVPNTGVDQTANWQRVLDAASAYAIAHGAAMILAKDGVYKIPGEPVQNSQYNAQLTLPFISSTNQRAALTIASKTYYSHNPTPYRYPGAPISTGAVILESTLTGLSYSGTYGLPCILGGPDPIHGTAYTDFSYMSLHLKGVAVRAPVNPSICGVNAQMLNRFIAEDFRADTTDTALGLLTAAQPTHPTGLSILMPLNNMDGSEYRGWTEVSGWYAGPGVGELVNNAGVIFSAQNYVNLNIQTYTGTTASGFLHRADFGHAILTRAPYQIASVNPSTGVAAPSAVAPLNYTMITGQPDFEDEAGTGTWLDLVADVYDPNNKLTGLLHFNRILSTAGGPVTDPLVQNGGFNLVTLNIANPGAYKVNINSAVGQQQWNTNSGTAAQAIYQVQTDTGYGSLEAFSSGFSDTELRSKVGLTASADQLFFATQGNAGIVFYTKGRSSTKARYGFTADGAILGFPHDETAAISTANSGRLSFSPTLFRWQMSESGSAYYDVIPSLKPVTYASTLPLNFAPSQTQSATLTGNVSVVTLSNLRIGGVYRVRVVQGGAGSYTISWGAGFKWVGGSAPTLSTAVGSVDIFQFLSPDGLTLEEIGRALDVK
jgi:hypothetical protein